MRESARSANDLKVRWRAPPQLTFEPLAWCREWVGARNQRNDRQASRVLFLYRRNVWSGPSGACAGVDRKTRVTIQRKRQALGNSFAVRRILTRHLFRHLGKMPSLHTLILPTSSRRQIVGDSGVRARDCCNGSEARRFGGAGPDSRASRQHSSAGSKAKRSISNISWIWSSIPPPSMY